MIPSLETSVLSAHLRFHDRDAVVNVLGRLGVAVATPLPVWPAHRLPYGLFLSGVRNGWISLWSPRDDMRDWFPEITGSLECPGLLTEVVQSRFLIVEFLQDGDLHGRVELPTEAVEWDDLWARTVESLESEGIVDPTDNEPLFNARMDEIARSQEYRDDLERLREERPTRDTLRAYLPPKADADEAWDLLMALDRDARDVDDEEELPIADDYLDEFAECLGIEDAAWDPGADSELLSEGDYDEEGLPAGWREFVVLPIPHLTVL